MENNMSERQLSSPKNTESIRGDYSINGTNDGDFLVFDKCSGQWRNPISTAQCGDVNIGIYI